jgi:preprotein translocase subunit SecG
MFTLPLAVGIVMNLLMVLWVAIALFLVMIVLIQKAKGGGLSSAFGGMGASSLLGTKTGDVLTWVTISLAAVFLALGAVLVKFYRPSEPTDLRNPPATAPATAVPGAGDATTAPGAGAPAGAVDGAAAPQPAASTPVEIPAAPVQPAPAPAPAETPAAPAAPAAPANPAGN